MASGHLSVCMALLLLGVADCGPLSPRKSYSCDLLIYLNYGERFYITTPRYPNPYPSPLRCMWYVESPPGTILYANFLDFKVPCHRFESFLWESGADVSQHCGHGQYSITSSTNSFTARLDSRVPHFLSVTRMYIEIIVLSSFQDTTATTQQSVITQQDTTTTITIAQPAPDQCGMKAITRIVGGEVATVNEWRWQVALRWFSTNSIFCSGSLLSSEWVFTAAHCVDGVRDLRAIYVTVGDYHRDILAGNSYRVSVRVAKVVKHERYSAVTVDNDVALLQLNTPVQYNQAVAPVCLPCGLSEDILLNESGTVTGWGTESFQGTPSPVLLEVELPLLTTTECRQYLGRNITDNMLCTYEEGKDACQGDSGGPLTWKDGAGQYYLVGVVSWGIGCADKHVPGVYAKVMRYTDWIQKKTSIDFCDSGTH
ncbi:Chymotrypsinogen B [Portunus trituberculatus]|uniref:Chymotrypsinogen B n=1 Tax=Portunus trituberculatus TaxID=210409 RepID=A0A5B7FUW6_PORTR|nr:Chymotrypsinogen B [Portunus trituberculatus]